MHFLHEGFDNDAASYYGNPKDPYQEITAPLTHDYRPQTSKTPYSPQNYYYSSNNAQRSFFSNLPSNNFQQQLSPTDHVMYPPNTVMNSSQICSQQQQPKSSQYCYVPENSTLPYNHNSSWYNSNASKDLHYYTRTVGVSRHYNNRASSHHESMDYYYFNKFARRPPNASGKLCSGLKKENNTHFKKESNKPFYTKFENPTLNRFACKPCDKTFTSEKRLRLHLLEDHVKCEDPECTYSAPPHILDVHKLSHLKTEDGVSILNNKKEIKLWLESRLQNFPTRKRIQELQSSQQNIGYNQRKKNQSSILEKMLRSRINCEQGPKSLHRRILETSALFPQFQAMLKRRRVSKLQVGSSTGYSEFTDEELMRPFPICEHFLKHKKCKWNPCNYSHDVSVYHRWKLEQHARGFDVPKRPPLMYQLLLPDIKQFELKLLQIFRYFVEENFFASEDNAKSHENETTVVTFTPKEYSNGFQEETDDSDEIGYTSSSTISLQE